MLKDITIGQYFPGQSVVHRLDPRMKILLTIGYIVLLFLANQPLGFLLAAILLAVCYWVAKIPVRMIGKSLKPIIPILIFTAVFNLFFISGWTELFHWWIFRLTTGGLYTAFTMAVRIVLASAFDFTSLRRTFVNLMGLSTWMRSMM